MMKETNQFAQLWIGQVNDYKNFEIIFIQESP